VHCEQKEFDLRLICGGFYVEFAKLPTSRVESEKSGEFRLSPGGGLFFE
jgi:hypothetical protein